ncbi:MAG: site-specific DNA-methyltransferase [Candidatus Gracilibacteria bacterium]
MPSFHFKGKAFLQNYHHSVKFHKLTPMEDKGTIKKPSLSDNLLVQGDNLKVLKALLPTHAGKVKCIYIDPPYNTGKENWVYNDNVASPMIQEWLGKVVAKDDLTRHDKWCCMMYPRLTLLREFLKPDGVIFVSIDSNEIHHLRMMMDEIFGEENFIAIVPREMKKGANRGTHFAPAVDYVLCYAKNIESVPEFFMPLDEEYINSFKYDDDDGRGKYKKVALYEPTLDYYKNCRYEITCPDGSKITTPERKSFRCNKESFERLFAENSIIIEEKPSKLIDKNDKPTKWNVYTKLFLNAMKEKGRRPSDIVLNKINAKGTKVLTDLGLNFNFSKPVELIAFLLSIIENPNNDNKEDTIILDSFAGSGTTAHAVLALNKEDGGNRKFILVECEDYADKITGERIRRVIKGVPDAKDEALQKGLGGSFSYYKLGKELEVDKILEGTDLPSYEELARYALFTATGENWKESKMKQDEYYIGSSSTFEVYMLYAPDKKKLKELALNLDFAIKSQKRFPNKQKLIFAPACFMEEYHLKEYGIRFAQLPFEIYRMAE